MTYSIGLMIAGLAMIAAAATIRALAPMDAPSASVPTSIVLRHGTAESPESIATRVCRDLATGIPRVEYQEGTRSLVACESELHTCAGPVPMWTMYPHSAAGFVTMTVALDELDRAISAEVRAWRARPEAMERDVRWTVR
jgi:hypothetical protein